MNLASRAHPDRLGDDAIEAVVRLLDRGPVGVDLADQVVMDVAGPVRLGAIRLVCSHIAAQIVEPRDGGVAPRVRLGTQPRVIVPDERGAQHRQQRRRPTVFVEVLDDEPLDVPVAIVFGRVRLPDGPARTRRNWMIQPEAVTLSTERT